MRRLLLLRHAKSSWSSTASDDFARPLASRGREAAPRIGCYLREQGLVPDHVLCSTATRARETWALVEAELGRTPEATYHDDLYLAEPAAMLALLRKVPDAASTVMIIGHNPGMQVLALQLAGKDGGERAAEIARKFPTAGLAVFRCAATRWATAGKADFALVEFARPRELS
ncbi:SixA phosphatase family protein [Oceanibacterium hippocampi]|uniref:Phosphohistidine phosphatase n=1 Tax=Oceanibacterium hippocampi TaxID=745714 RepID=A0A1Y5TY39_9PROT|nr:histidine phosphatase family protein [Oceanibacterium hippocampi]SLN76733.1 phosphohistidine phosphatase [Oceanibacterium hippocampi]